MIALDDPTLMRGWWAPEWSGLAPERWPAGNAVLPLRAFAAPSVLEIEASPANMVYAIERRAA